MAGALTISTLNNDTGVLATQNGMTGIAKAWVNYNGSGSAIRSSFNVSSVTVNGTGDYTANFTTAMPDVNYSAQVTCNYDNAGGMTDGAVGNQTTTTCRFICHDIAGGTKYNPYAIYLTVNGN